MLPARLTNRSRDYSVPPAVVVGMLKETLPFSFLSESAVEVAAEGWVIDYFPKGTVLGGPDGGELNHVHLIQNGAVKKYRLDRDGREIVMRIYGSGHVFGVEELLQSTSGTGNYTAAENTYCFLLAKEHFLDLLTGNSRLLKFFRAMLPEDLVRAVRAELKRHGITPKDRDKFYLFNTMVRELVSHPPRIVPKTATVRDAAVLMSTHGVGSVLVEEPGEGIVGIVTDKDLRSRVIAHGLDPDSMVDRIMSAPVSAVRPEAYCFDALLMMMKEGIHHLGVEGDEGVIGVVSSHDILVYQGVSPMSLLREITSQSKVEGLFPLYAKIPAVVRSMIEEGAEPNNIARMVTLLNDNILNRLLILLAERIGPSPVPFCWIIMGGEGRKEQVFGTGLSNALVYMDPAKELDPTTVESYFRVFTHEAVKLLQTCGYPLLRQSIIAAEARWRQPFSIWRRYFDGWVSTADPKGFSYATAFLDFRVCHGNGRLGNRLRNRLNGWVLRQHVFLARLATELIGNRPPVAFFGDFAVDGDGRHRNRLDLDARGVSPLVQWARLMAMLHGIVETNTLDRLQLIAAESYISRALYTDLREAYEFQKELLLVHHLEQIETGQKPDNYLDPARLTRLQKETLCAVFRVIDHVLDRTRRAFPMLM
ncbi:MAG: putative nucleotidyltransferase substrate binding domain-containing protein [Pseudomonadota bacterium]